VHKAVVDIRAADWIVAGLRGFGESVLSLVATEVDFKTTYIGADRSCAHELTSLPGVEAATVSPELGVDWLSDTLNPRQTSP
jgi:hypothetical protein